MAITIDGQPFEVPQDARVTLFDLIRETHGRTGKVLRTAPTFTRSSRFSSSMTNFSAATARRDRS